MPLIGSFTRTPDGFAGRIRTLSLEADIVLVPAEPSDADNAPDYRIHFGGADDMETGPEVGAGWKRTGERAGDYVAVLLDDPVFAQPIRANLFRADDDGRDWSLHWTRSRKRGAGD